MDYQEMMDKQNKIVQEIMDLARESKIAAAGVIKMAEYLLSDLVSIEIISQSIKAADKEAAREDNIR